MTFDKPRLFSLRHVASMTVLTEAGPVPGGRPAGQKREGHQNTYEYLPDETGRHFRPAIFVRFSHLHIQICSNSSAIRVMILEQLPGG